MAFYNTASGKSYSNINQAFNDPQGFSKPEPRWVSNGVMPAQQQGVPWSPGIANTHVRGLDGQWYNRRSGYTQAPAPSNFTPVSFGSSGAATSPMSGGVRGSAGGAPQGPYGAYMSGTPDNLDEGREMAYAGTLDPWRDFYKNAGSFQDVLRREVAIAGGQDRLNYDPLRAEAADQAARAAQIQGQRGQMQANRANLNYGVGSQYQATAPIREAYGKSLRDIGFQESRDQRAMEQAARAQVANLWQQQLGAVAPASSARLNQLNMLEETSGMPMGLFGTQRGAAAGDSFGGLVDLGGMRGNPSQARQARQAQQYLQGRGEEGISDRQYAWGKAQGWWD